MKRFSLEEFFKKNVIFEDSHRGYDFFIKFNDFFPPGHHCAYVRIPRDHPYFEVHYDDINISVHGGLTFSEMVDGEYWIGWDYGHGGDKVRNFDLIDYIKDCCSVIMQLPEIQK